MQLLNVGASDAAAPSSVGKPGLRVCGVTRNVQSRPRCSDSDLGGCDECEQRPSADADVIMSDACSSPVAGPPL